MGLTTTTRDAFERVAKRQKLSSSKAQEVIDQVGQEIQQALFKLQSVNDTTTFSADHKSILTDLKYKLKELGPLNQLIESQKELNVSMVKYTKLLEKFFNPDISKAYRNVDFDVYTVNKIIAAHFYRQGLFDLGDCFISEASELEVTTLRAHFLEMYMILKAIKSRNLEPALNWAVSNRDHLLQNGSGLELKLHQTQFGEILQKGNTAEALDYARTYFVPLATEHMAEIQKLMTCLLWTGRLECSPYAEYISPTRWEKLPEEVTQQFCSLLGQSYESPLSGVIVAGAQALPTLLKLASVMASKKQEWETMKQFPVPVDLSREFHFHSIFVCPVSRDQASEENPPMLLPCGHVVCKQSVIKLSKSSTRMFKCPYCPSEAVVTECRQLHF